MSRVGFCKTCGYVADEDGCDVCAARRRHDPQCQWLLALELILEAGSASYGPPVTRYLILDPDDVSTRYHTGDGDWSQRRDKAHRYSTIEAACADIRGCDAAQLFDLQVVVDVDAYAVAK